MTELTPLSLNSEIRPPAEDFKRVLDASPAVHFLIHPGGEMGFVSQAVERIYGVNLEQVMNGKIKLTEMIHPGDKKRVEEKMAGLQERKEVEVIYRVQRPDGKDVLVTETCRVTENGDVVGSITNGMSMFKLVAGSVAHNLRNLMTPSVGYSDMLATDSTVDSKILPDLQAIAASNKETAGAIEVLMNMAESRSSIRFVEGYQLLDLQPPKAK